MAKAAVKPTVIKLPQLDQRSSCGTLRPSKRGKWRAAALIGVYVLAGVHMLHWWQTGRSVSPVEPSESIQTIRDGLVNAGFIFFIVAIVSTLIFGRFFCGWGCHIVALQDLCTWALKKIGLRPKPFRARMLMWVPLGLAIYMFIVPLLERAWFDRDLPPLKPHLLTDEMWATFPAWTMSILTLLLAGFLIVYLLGNKGFCTYGCPYGGFFAPADYLAPGKIRVTDACEGCGHCTATCTSNVRVHEEVRTFGMVVDPGCMKCLDCIDVCPNDALYFGFGRPAVAAGAPRAPRRQREYDFTLREEFAMLAIFLFTVYATRGLYLTEPVPLLTAVAIAAMSAYVLLLGMRLFYSPNVRFHTWKFKLHNRLARSGVVFGAGCLVWLAFLGHSAVVQFLTREGARLERETERVIAHNPAARAEANALASQSVERYEAAARLGLVSSPWVYNALGDLYYFLATPADREARLAQVETNYRRALRIEPRIIGIRTSLARLYRERNDLPASLALLREEFEISPGARGSALDLVARAFELKQPEVAVDTLRRAVTRRPYNADARMELGSLLVHLGRVADGIVELERAARDAPESQVVSARLSDAYVEQAAGHLGENRVDPAQADLERALRLNERNPRANFFLAQILKSRGDLAGCRRHLDLARREHPTDPGILDYWYRFLASTGELARTIDELAESTKRATAAGNPDDMAEFQLLFLYSATGDQPRATEIYERLSRRRPELFGPPGGN